MAETERDPRPTPTHLGILVGRKRESERLRAALADAASGRGRIVMLAGEPGVGKTRLAREIAERAVTEGARVLWGRCWDREGAPPFWPWIQVLREAVAGVGSDDLPVQARARLPQLAAMFPELRAALPDLVAHGNDLHDPPPAAATEDAAAARFRLFDSISNLLRSLTEAGPLVIVLDDLHTADPDSLVLLSFFVRDLRTAKVLVVAIYREVEARLSPEHAELLGEIRREAEVLKLSGLTADETADLVERARGNRPEPALVDSLQRATAGNPFFLWEIITLTDADRTRARPGEVSSGVPEGIGALIARRLEPLSHAAKSVLRAASVIANDIELPIMRRVCGVPDDELHDALQEAESRGLLSPAPETPGHYRFNHGLTSDALRSQIARVDLMRLHHSIAQAIEEVYGADNPGMVSRLAHHYLEAGSLGPLAKAIAYTRLAAQQARSQVAYGEAARLYQLALHADAQLPVADPRQKCELLLGSAEVLGRLGKRNEARDRFEAAAGISRQGGDLSLFARAVLGMRESSKNIFVSDAKIVELLEQALAAFGENDTDAFRAVLLGGLAEELFWSDRRDRSFSLSRQAVDLARRVGQPWALASTLLSRLSILWGPEDLEQRLATATEIAGLAEQGGDWDAVLKARELRLAALLELGSIDEVQAEIRTCETVAERLGVPSFTVAKFRVMHALVVGDFARAESLLAELLEVGQRQQNPLLLVTYAGQLGQLRGEQGRTEELEPMLKAPADELPAFITARCGLALYYARVRRLDDARVEFEYLASNNFSRIQRDWNWLGTIALLSEVCALLNDRVHAPVLYDLLRPYAARGATLGWGDIYYAPISYYLGLLAATMNQPDQAQVHFEAALRFNTMMRAKPSLARTQVAYAGLLLARGQVGDSKQGLALLESALATAQALGMKSVAEEAQRLSQAGRTTSVVSTTRTPDSPSATPTAAVNSFRREGEFWTIAYRGKIFRLRDTKGLAYIAQLLGRPGAEFHSLDLMAGTPIDGPDGAAESDESIAELRELSEDRLAESSMHRGLPDHAGEMLDPQAKAAYRQRLIELNEGLAKARKSGNSERGTRLEDEIEALEQELRRAVGLGGRDRRAGSTSERARLSVTRAIKAAIQRIAENDPELGALLGKAIRTGIFCSYSPDVRRPVSWEL